MDKKQKKKLVPAVCFILICGVVYLGIHYGGQRKEQIVLEEQDEVKEMQGSATEVLPVNGTDTVSETAEKQDETIYVHVCGAVVAEGVYALQNGSRVTDAIVAAGGFCEGADTTYHNLAAFLTDGQKVYVPTCEETQELSVTDRIKDTVAGTSNENPKGNGTTTERCVNLNTASYEELMTLSGIGEAKAESILQYREKVGSFQSIEELKNVSGIGEAMFDRIKNEIVVE